MSIDEAFDSNGDEDEEVEVEEQSILWWLRAVSIPLSIAVGFIGLILQMTILSSLGWKMLVISGVVFGVLVLSIIVEKGVGKVL